MIDILQVKNLSIDFLQKSTTVHAIVDLSVDIKEGKCLAIVGESGSGKSTLALAIANLLPNNAYAKNGQILYRARNGEVIDIIRLNPFSEKLRYIRGNEIGIIFQEPSSCLNPSYTVGWQLDEKRKFWDRKSKELRESEIISQLREMGFLDPKHIYNSYPFQLSGGMNQRIMISMFLSPNLRLLICDEPTSALDVTTQRQILILLKDLQDRYRFAMMFITHNLDIARVVSDEILVMYRGFCVEKGENSQLMDEPLHPYTRYLINSAKSLRNGSRMLTVSSVRKTYIQGCPFHQMCPEALPKCSEIIPPQSTFKRRILRCWLYE